MRREREFKMFVERGERERKEEKKVFIEPDLWESVVRVFWTFSYERWKRNENFPPMGECPAK